MIFREAFKKEAFGIGFLNINGAHVTTNKTTYNNVEFLCVSDLKIVYNSN